MTQPFVTSPDDVALTSETSQRGLRALPWLPLLLYLLLSIVLWKPFQYIMYKDEINFITIAERYARGEWASAPNAIWPPLLSWLEALAFKTGLRTEVAVKSLSLLFGVFAYLALQQLFIATGIGPRMRVWFSLAAVPALFYFAVFGSGADLLLTSILILYLSVVLRPISCEKQVIRRAAACGIIGALAYFCKNYGLYFFLAHFTLVTVVNVVTATTARERCLLLKGFATAIGITAVLVAVWVGAVRNKYGVTTLGVIGSYNLLIRNPNLPGTAEELVPPLQYVGFVEPPPTATVSVWEEAYYVYKMLDRWSPFESLRAFFYELRVARANLSVTVNAFRSFTPFWLAIISAAVLLWLGPSSPRERKVLGIILVTLILLPAGYWPVYSHERYLWSDQILLLCLAAFLMQKLWTYDWLRIAPSRWVLTMVIGLSFVVYPTRQLWVRANAGKEIHDLGELVAQEGLANARIASNGDYSNSVCVAYRVHAKYYGQPKPGIAIAALEQELVKYDIDYYFAWGKTRFESSLLEKRKDFKVGTLALSIYTVQKPPASIR
jgi:hypothetical protein